MKNQPFILNGTSSSELLREIEQTLVIRCDNTSKQIRQSLIVIIGAIFLALLVPLLTWGITLKNVTSSEEGNLGIFAFSSIPMAGVFVLISVTMLRRRRALEEQLDRIEDHLFEFRKLRALAQAIGAPELNIYREITLTKALSGLSIQSPIGKEDDEVSGALNIYSALVKVVNDVRPKK